MKIRKSQVIMVLVFLALFSSLNYFMSENLDDSTSTNQANWEATKNQLGNSKLTPEEIRKEVKSEVLLNNPPNETPKDKTKKEKATKPKSRPHSKLPTNTETPQDTKTNTIIPKYENEQNKIADNTNRNKNIYNINKNNIDNIKANNVPIDQIDRLQDRIWGSKREGTCKHTYKRDYKKDPIVIADRFHGMWKDCDIPCSGSGHEADASSGGSSQCGHGKSIFFSMENVQLPTNYDIACTVNLNSDVPLPYFNWIEYNFRRLPVEKTASSHVAAFISNCGPQKRQDWMKRMVSAGIKIDSYGSCGKNKNVDSSLHTKYGGDYNAVKIDTVSRYKFTMSFENSESHDYVTEKMYGCLVAGSIPLYNGAPNAKKFAPDDHSVIFAEDFESPEEMANYLLYLDGNDTAYNEYFEWKYRGPSDEFVALMDIGNVHSNCRLCIRTADLHRREVGAVLAQRDILGEFAKGEHVPENIVILKARERGKFWLYPIYLVERSITELRQKINENVPHDERAYIYSIYTIWSNGKKTISNDDDVVSLENGEELEIVFVISQKIEGPIIEPWYSIPPP